MSISISYSNGQYVVRMGYEDSAAREDLKQSVGGRRWDGDRKVWRVPGASAAQLAEWAERHLAEVDASAREAMTGYHRAIDASQAAETAREIEIPRLGGELRPFQRAGVAYLIDHPQAILADEMGLGKTVQALAAIEARAGSGYPALVVCPASLRLNWEREAQRWLPGRATRAIGVHGGGKAAKAEDERAIREADIVIVNYETVGKHAPALRGRGFASLVADEAHYLKNGKAQRTRAVAELAEAIPARYLLTGTPVVNRPAELISPLRIVGRFEQVGGSWRRFVERYCDGHKGRYGWDISGASNLDELGQKLRATCFVRREKADVLAELPEKTVSVVPIEYDRRAYEQAHKAARDEIRANLGAGSGEHLAAITRLRHAAAEAKLGAAAGWVGDFLESGEKLVVFAHHRDIQQRLYEAFEDRAVRVTGEQSAEDRQRAVDRFQSDPDVRLIVCSIQAGGVGLTLTAASNVAFVELPWTPGELQQAEDRVHRIGQRDAVTVYRLVAPETIDESMARLLEDKRRVIDQAVGRTAIIDSIVADVAGVPLDEIRRARRETARELAASPDAPAESAARSADPAPDARKATARDAELDLGL